MPYEWMFFMTSSSEAAAKRGSRSEADQCGRSASPPLYLWLTYQSETAARPPNVKES